ncbi:hypothetical protein BX070DRAFT_220316 [Coemansia spiralis]|nr:hypothetical protein BX070DRAFT_220316 [Coemansia spiralis]
MPSGRTKDPASSSLPPANDIPQERRWSASDLLFRRWSTKRQHQPTEDVQPSSPPKKRPSVLVRRSSGSAAAKKTAATAAPKDPPTSPRKPQRTAQHQHQHQEPQKNKPNAAAHQHQPQKNKPNAAAHQQQPRRSKPNPAARQRRHSQVDLNGTSTANMHKPTKEKPSLNSTRPRTVFHGIQAPRFLRALLNGGSDNRNSVKKGKQPKKKSHSHSRPKQQKQKPAAKPSTTKSRHKSSHSHSSHRSDKKKQHPPHEHRHHLHNMTDREAGAKPLPKADSLSLAKTSVAATSVPTVRFSEPPEQHIQASDTLPIGVQIPPAGISPKNNIVAMPVPKHYTAGQAGRMPMEAAPLEDPNLRLSGFGLSQHSYTLSDDEARPGEVAVLQPLPQRFYIDSQDPNRLSTASRNSVMTTGGESHISSYTDPDENDEGKQQTVRVYRILGHRNTNERMDINSQAARVRSPLLVTIANDGSIVGESTYPHRSTGNVHPNKSSGALTKDMKLSAGSTESAEAATSLGTESFATAQLFTGRPSSDEYHSADSDNVSDIAMRAHLSVDEENIMGSSFPSSQPSSPHSNEEQAVDNAFFEWLRLQAATDHPPPQDLQRNQPTISQTVAQSTSAMPLSYIHNISHASSQRHYSPSSSQRNSTFAPYLQKSDSQVDRSSRIETLVAQLLARVSDLESRFVCMEAIMASIEEKLAGLTTTAAPSISRSLSMKRAMSAFSAAGKMPEVKTFGSNDVPS